MSYIKYIKNQIKVSDSWLEKTSLVFYAIIFVLITANIILASNQGIQAITNAGHDDRLFLNLADNILKGQYLGNYTRMTLAKGAFYPLFIAINFVIGLPLLLAQRFFYILSGLLLIAALKNLLYSRTWSIIILGLYLYNPVSFAIDRVLRDGIYTSLTIMVLAGAIGVIASLEKLDDKKNRSLIWAVFLGIAFSLFWLTREEGIWIVPSLFIILMAGLWKLWKLWKFNKVISGRKRRKLLFILILPILIYCLIINSVSLLNYVYYGWFTTTEFQSPSFVSAYGSLIRVKNKNWKPYIPVPTTVRQEIYKVSPAFKELQPFLEGERKQNWSEPGCQQIPSTCGDMAGGWFVWAFRDSVSLAGYYESGPIANNYYKRLSAEINQACDNGKLTCLPPQKTLAPPFYWDYINPLFNSLMESVKIIISFQQVNFNQTLSSGDKEGIEFYEDITHNRVNPRQEDLMITIDKLERTIKLVEFKNRILEKITQFYKLIIPLGTILSLTLFTIRGYWVWKRKFISTIFAINFSLLVAFLIRIFLIAYIDATSFPSIYVDYLAACYPILFLFICLNIDEFTSSEKNQLFVSDYTII